MRGGGHSAAGMAVSDGGLMIDLSGMRGVRVDPVARTARAQGGATWGDYDRETQVFGLASTGGAISTTGIAGLTLGGGLGYLTGKHGLAIDNLLSADVVTADGEVVTATPYRNDDLFWALRGGGGNFGVVTSFEYRVHPVGPMVTGGLVAYPAAAGRDVLDFFKGFIDAAPDEVTTFGGFAGAPDGSTISLMIPMHCGSLEEGAQALAPLKQVGTPVMDMVGPIPYTAQQSMLDPGFGPGSQVYWKSTFLRELSPGAIDVLVRYGQQLPTPMCGLLVEHLHGAFNRVPADATAFAQRDVQTNVAIVGIWNDPADHDRCFAWVRGVFADLQPFSTGGVYVNYLGIEEAEGRVQAAYGANYDRLSQIKAKYDPTNLFRVNQNIAPRA